MTLTTGQSLSFYEILGPLGAGAMGEVYRAKDTRLDREVAIKILSEHFADDEERLRRFEREAKSIAALNHSNVAQIHSVDQVEDICFLVLELVPGETLEDRISRGALPVEEAVDVCRQIAEGLEAAHDAGVIHRDLKPANVRITPDGKVKVLDFGLAKPTGPPVEGGVAESSTDSVLATEAGRLLGTPIYMAPEQARGKPIDRRVDVWAFGCVLYECLTGRRAFDGESMADVLAAVVHEEANFARLPPATPAYLIALLERCLEKDTRRRLRDIGEARVALTSEVAASASSIQRRGVPVARPRTFPITIAGVLAGLVVGWGAARMGWLSSADERDDGGPSHLGATRFTVQTAGSQPLGDSWPVALSPDGRTLAYSVGFEASASAFLLDFTEFEARLLEGGEGGDSFFFSPDSDVVGFHSANDNRLYRTRLSGGSSTQVAESAGDTGASWGDDGTLVFGSDWGQPLRILRPGDTESQILTKIDTEVREGSHLWPQVLPGSKAVLLTAWTARTWDEAVLAVADVESGAHEVVLRNGTGGRYTPSGHLVFWRGGSLMAVPFDADRLVVKGEPVKVVDGVRLSNSNGAPHLPYRRLARSPTSPAVSMLSLRPSSSTATASRSCDSTKTGRSRPRPSHPMAVGSPSPCSRRAPTRSAFSTSSGA